MLFVPCLVDGARMIEPTSHQDSRGLFARAWCRDEFSAAGIEFSPVQANTALSLRKGTMRGLHFQVAPALEAKLVRCVRGAIFDVVVDLRPQSPTYRAWFGTILSSSNRRALYIPEGCAHGCLSTEDDTEIQYMASAAHSPAHARGVRFDDPAFGVRWPIPATVVSDQDNRWPAFAATSEGELA